MPRLSGRLGLTGSGLLRVGVGTVLMARPTLLPRALGVDSSTARKVGWLSPMIGARDVALGAGLVHATRRARDPRPWLVAAAVADAVDAVAFGTAVVRRDVRPASGALCTAAAVAGVLTGTQTLRELAASG